MRKVLLIISLIAISVYGCASKNVAEPTVAKTKSSCMNGAPEWVINGGQNGGVSGVGSSIINRAGLQYARIEALSLARDDIGELISTKVDNTFNIFLDSVSIKRTEAMSLLVRGVSRQVASQVIGASRVAESWISQCDELFILANVESSVVKSSVKDNIISAFRTDSLLWQQFQAKKMQYDLEAAIEREFRDGALK